MEYIFPEYLRKSQNVTVSIFGLRITLMPLSLKLHWNVPLLSRKQVQSFCFPEREFGRFELNIK